MSLDERVVLVRLKISDYRGAITDYKTTEEVRAMKNASHGANRSIKFLLRDNDYFKECASAIRALRTYNEKVTIPWEDGGLRALPIEHYFEYGAKTRDLQARISAGVTNFVANLDELKEEDRNRMGDLFDEADYPTPEQLEEMYQVDIHLVPLQNLDDIRVRIPEEDIAKMKRGCEDLFEEKLRNASMHLWDRLYKSIKRMVDNLEGNARIYDTMIGNIVDLVQMLPSLNIGDDPELAYMAREIEDRIVKRYTTDDIKSDSAVRERAHDDAQEMLDKIDSVLAGWS